MKVWILGAGGQLGSALIDCAQSLKIPFVASSRALVDITDLEVLKRVGEKHGCTHVINCAAYTNVDDAEKESKRAFAVNAEGAENVGIVARELGLRVVHVSTDYVFDGEKRAPYLETDRTNPLGAYGKSKREGEERLLAEFPTACIVRTSWMFGHYGKNFISSIIHLLQNKEHVQVVDDQINRATYNRDLSLALIDLSCHSGIFHFANDRALSRYQIAQDFFECGKRRNLPMRCVRISPVSSEKFVALGPRPSYSVLDTTKASLALGRKPRMWDTVLEEFFNYVKPLF